MLDDELTEDGNDENDKLEEGDSVTFINPFTNEENSGVIIRPLHVGVYVIETPDYTHSLFASLKGLFPDLSEETLSHYIMVRKQRIIENHGKDSGDSIASILLEEV